MICTHPQLRVSRLDVYRGMGTFELWTRFDRLQAYPHVTATHIRNLLGMLPDEQKVWLDRIQEQLMTTRDLEQALAATRAPKVEDDGADALGEVRLAFRQLDEITCDKEGLIADLERAGIAGEAVQRLGAALETLTGPLQEVRALLTEPTTARPRA
jgi:hypothetical protein